MSYLSHVAREGLTFVEINDAFERAEEALEFLGIRHDAARLVVRQITNDRLYFRQKLSYDSFVNFPDVKHTRLDDYLFLAVPLDMIDTSRISVKNHPDCWCGLNEYRKGPLDKPFVLLTGDPVLNKQEDYWFDRHKCVTYLHIKLPIRDKSGHIFGPPELWTGIPSYDIRLEIATAVFCMGRAVSLKAKSALITAINSSFIPLQSTKPLVEKEA